VGNFVHSMTTTSLKGSYFIVTPFSMVFGLRVMAYLFTSWC
jgi:hypothetical protein